MVPATKIRRSRFTVIEILVVIAVIGILAGLTLGIMGYAQKKTADTRTLATIEMLTQALEQYKEKYGFYLPSIPYDAENYIPFRLDIVDATAGSGVRCIKNNFCQFVDYQDLIKQSRKSDDVYLVLDGYQQSIYYRCPGYINKTSYDIGSVGTDGYIGTTTKTPSTGSVANFKTDFGKGDDITNCKR